MGLTAYVRPAFKFLLSLVDHDLVANVVARASPQPVAVTAGQPVVKAHSAPENGNKVVRSAVDLASNEPGPAQAVTPAPMQLSNVAAIVSPPSCKVVNGPCKLLWSHFDLSDFYLFERRPFSIRKMTHVVALTSESGNKIPACSLDAEGRAQISNALTEYLLGGLDINFNGPDLLVSCSFQWELEKIFCDIEAVMPVPYKTQVKSKGLPFIPAFWILKGLSTSEGKFKLSADIQSYIVRNERTFGKWRVVYASEQKIPCVGFSFLTGDVVIVTDAETIRSHHGQALPVFQGSKPRRIQSIHNLQKFS